MFGRKKTVQLKEYDPDSMKPVLKCSICNGEQVAGFKHIHTGKFEEGMLINGSADFETFKTMYEITGEIEKIY